MPKSENNAKNTLLTSFNIEKSGSLRDLRTLIFSPTSWEDIFKFSTSADASILKHQVQPHSFPWFSACGAIVHRSHIFHLYQQNKSVESNIMLRQASNCCKNVLGTAKLVTCKITESITSQKRGSEANC